MHLTCFVYIYMRNNISRSHLKHSSNRTYIYRTGHSIKYRPKQKLLSSELDGVSYKFTKHPVYELLQSVLDKKRIISKSRESWRINYYQISPAYKKYLLVHVE